MLAALQAKHARAAAEAAANHGPSGAGHVAPPPTAVPAAPPAVTAPEPARQSRVRRDRPETRAIAVSLTRYSVAGSVGVPGARRDP